MEKKNSETFYESVINGEYDSRLKKSMEHIRAACDEIEGFKGIISVGVVGAYCKDNYKGPAAQSIRNKADTLKRYIDLRSAEQVNPVKKDSDDVKMKISDPKVRFYVLQLEDQRNLYAQQTQRLQKFIQSLAPVEMDAIIAQAFSGISVNEDILAGIFKPEKNELNSKIEISAAVRKALEKITDDEYLRTFGLELYKGHLILSSTKKTFLSNKEVSALIELLEKEETVSSETKLLNGKTDVS